MISTGWKFLFHKKTGTRVSKDDVVISCSASSFLPELACNNKMLSGEFSGSQFIENQMCRTLGVPKVSSGWEHHEDFMVENMQSQIYRNYSVQWECQKKHDGCHDERHLEDGTLYGRREYHQGQLCCWRNWKWVLLQGLWRLLLK
jgi:hypothetical protein